MRYGKTTTSVHLRKTPSAKGPILDSLEPNYPLRVIGYRPQTDWLHVIVPPLGKRDEAQDGYIDARYVRVEDEPEPWLRPAEWIAALALAAIVLAAFAASMFYR